MPRSRHNRKRPVNWPSCRLLRGRAVLPRDGPPNPAESPTGLEPVPSLTSQRKPSPTLAPDYTPATGREATSDAAKPCRGRRMAQAEFSKPLAEAGNDVRRGSWLLDALALRCRTPSCSSLPGYWLSRWRRRSRPTFGVVDDPRGKRQNSKGG
jgi:hypothetical protein